MVKRSRLSKKNSSVRFIVRNRETGRLHKWNVETALREINRDRSSTWTPYDKTDWVEGLNEFTEYEYIGKVKK
jgi:hypothetical protein